MYVIMGKLTSKRASHNAHYLGLSHSMRIAQPPGWLTRDVTWSRDSCTSPPSGRAPCIPPVNRRLRATRIVFCSHLRPFRVACYYRQRVVLARPSTCGMFSGASRQVAGGSASEYYFGYKRPFLLGLTYISLAPWKLYHIHISLLWPTQSTHVTCA